MTVKLGIRVGSWAYMLDYPHLYDRTAGDYALGQYEAYVRQTGGVDLANYHAQAHRGSYALWEETWPQNSRTEGRWQRDIDNGTMIVFTAGNNSSVPTNATIDARGAELKAFMTLNAGKFDAIVFSYHHEPNGDMTADTWWSRMQNIMTRWDTIGVQRWVGTQAGVTITPGIIYAGPNLAGLTSDSLTAGGPYAAGLPLLNAWYPASNSFIWGPTGIQMACIDIYPGATSGTSGGATSRWRGLPELWGVSGVSSAFISWYVGRRATQNASGRVLLAGIFEWGWDHWDKMWPNATTRYFTNNPGTSPTPWWQQNVGTYPPTFRDGLRNLATYLTANPDLFYVVCYWDSIAGGSAPGSGRGQHMLDVGAGGYYQTTATAGTREEMWDAWLEFLRTPVFGIVDEPPPPDPTPSFVPGVVSPMTRVRTG